MKVYLNQRELGEYLNLPQDLLARRGWLATDGVLPPDVLVGDCYPGWTSQRMLLFGKALGVLDASGHPAYRELGMPIADPAVFFPVRTRRFVSLTQGAQLWGVSRTVIFRDRRHPDFPDPVVKVGHAYGWRRSDIIRRGKVTGRLSQEGVPVPFGERHE